MTELFWAYYDKRHEGESRVLATSAGPGPEALDDLVRSMHLPGRAPLPVASFGPVTSSWLAMCLVEPADGRCFYALTHDEAARHGVTYAALLATAFEHPLPASSPVPIPGDGFARVARSVESLGPDWCTATAAAMLDGPVALRAPEQADVMARTEMLDAIMAMLPYGYRTSVLVGTHTEPGPHRTRLAFTGDADAVPVGSVPAEPSSPAARRYRTVLDGLVRDHTAPAVCAFLAADTRPRDIDDPSATAALPDELTELGLARSGAAFDLLYSAPDEQVTRGWLAESPPPWAEALQRLTDGSAEVTAGMLKRVTRPGATGKPDPEALARVLAVGASQTRLDAVSRHGWEVLAAVVENAPARAKLVAELDFIAERAAAPDPLTDAVRSVAHGKVLLPNRPAVEKYLTTFLHGLRRLGMAGWPTLDRTEVVTAVVERWRHRPDAAAWTLLLSAADHDREAVTTAVMTAVAERPNLMTGDGPWDRLEDVVPALRPVRAAHRLTAVLHQPDAPLREAREATANAVRCGVPACAVLTALHGWPQAEDPAVLDTLLWAMAGDGGQQAYFTVAHRVWSKPTGTRHRAWSLGMADQRLAEAGQHIAYARGVHVWHPEED